MIWLFVLVFGVAVSAIGERILKRIYR